MIELALELLKPGIFIMVGSTLIRLLYDIVVDAFYGRR